MSVGQHQNNIKTRETNAYKLVLPTPLYDELRNKAELRGITLLDFLKKLIKIGLLMYEIEDTEGSSLIIKEGDKETLLRII